MFPLGNGTGRNPLLPLPPISELAKVNLSKHQRHLTVQYSRSKNKMYTLTLYVSSAVTVLKPVLEFRNMGLL